MLVSEEEFEKLVEEALSDIPERFKDQMENLLISVEDIPSKSQLKRLNMKGTLLGLFDGVPKIGWGQAVMGIQPSKITIFRFPIMRRCDSMEQLRKLIKEVLLHEIGHYFGYDEKGIRELERKSRQKRKKQVE